MPLHPGDEATIRKVNEANAGGTHVTSYETPVSGPVPFELWLDDDRNLFGSVSSWQSIIAKEPSPRRKR